MKHLKYYIKEALIKKHLKGVIENAIDLKLPSGTVWIQPDFKEASEFDHYTFNQAIDMLKDTPYEMPTKEQVFELINNTVKNMKNSGQFWQATRDFQIKGNKDLILTLPEFNAWTQEGSIFIPQKKLVQDTNSNERKSKRAMIIKVVKQ